MAIEEQILSEISRSVSRVSDSSESFRTTANRQNSNIQKIVKDISEMFRSQSVSSSEMASSIDELQNQMAQTADKTDAVSARLSDTIEIQNSMLGELKGIGKGIDSLSNMILMMMQNSNSGFGGGGGGGGVATNLLKALAGTAGLGIGAGALASIFGSNYIQNNSTNNNTNSPQSQQGGGADQISNMLAAIKQKESGGEADPYTSIARGADNKPLPLGPNTGTGAYQFTPDTWQESARAANIDVSQYPQARDAPAELQDRVARARADYLLEKAQRTGGDISMLPVYWNAGENVTQITPRVSEYQQDVMSDYQKRQQSSQQQTATSSPGTSNDYAQFLTTRASGGVDAEKLNPSFAAKLMRAIQEAEQATGEKVVITSGVRSAEQQAQLYANYIRAPYNYNGKTYMPDPNNIPPMAAEPGNSAHETGNAVDLSDNKAREYIRRNAAKFGLQDIPGDPYHFSDRAESTPSRAGTTTAAAGATTVAGSENALDIATLLGTNTTEQQRTGSLMEGLGMPAGLGPGSEPRSIGMGDMSSYNPMGILGAAMGGNMFMPSGQSGAIGAALNVLSGATSGLFSPERPSPEQQMQSTQNQQQQTSARVDPDTYNHPEDRMVSPSWMDRLLGIYPNETSGVNTTYVGRDH